MEIEALDELEMLSLNSCYIPGEKNRVYKEAK